MSDNNTQAHDLVLIGVVGTIEEWDVITFTTTGTVSASLKARPAATSEEAHLANALYPIDLENPYGITEDLRGLVEMFKLHYARFCGLMGREINTSLDELQPPEGEMPKSGAAKKKYVEQAARAEWWERLRIRLQVNSLHFYNGMDKLKISGQLKDPVDGQAISMTTGMIHLEKSSYNFLADLQDDVATIVREVFLYMRGKVVGYQGTLWDDPQRLSSPNLLPGITITKATDDDGAEDHPPGLPEWSAEEE